MDAFDREIINDPHLLEKVTTNPRVNLVKVAMKHGPFNYRQIYLDLIEYTNVCLGNPNYKKICKSFTLEICTKEFFFRYWGMTMPNLNTIYLNEMCFERPIFLITTLMHEIKHIVADLEERKGFRSTIKYYYRVLTVHDYCHKGHFLNGLQNIEANYGVYILGNRILEGYDSAEKKKWKQQADVFRSIISGVMHRSWISCYKARIYSAKRKIWKNV